MTRLKKANAICALLSVLFMLLHIGSTCYMYATFQYLPTLKLLTSIPFMALVCLHAVLGMLAVFLQTDGTAMHLYPQQNAKTILQRVSAALIFPLLILHINTYKLIETAAKTDNALLLAVIIAAQLLFYVILLTHVVTSFSRAWITLGVLSSPETQKKIDRIVAVIGILVMIIAAIIIIRTQIIMIAGM